MAFRPPQFRGSPRGRGRGRGRGWGNPNQDKYAGSNSQRGRGGGQWNNNQYQQYNNGSDSFNGYQHDLRENLIRKERIRDSDYDRYQSERTQHDYDTRGSSRKYPSRPEGSYYDEHEDRTRRDDRHSNERHSSYSQRDRESHRRSRSAGRRRRSRSPQYNKDSSRHSTRSSKNNREYRESSPKRRRISPRRSSDRQSDDFESVSDVPLSTYDADSPMKLRSQKCRSTQRDENLPVGRNREKVYDHERTRGKRFFEMKNYKSPLKPGNKWGNCHSPDKRHLRELSESENRSVTTPEKEDLHYSDKADNNRDFTKSEFPKRTVCNKNPYVWIRQIDSSCDRSKHKPDGTDIEIESRNDNMDAGTSMSDDISKTSENGNKINADSRQTFDDSEVLSKDDEVLVDHKEKVVVSDMLADGGVNRRSSVSEQEKSTKSLHEVNSFDKKSQLEIDRKNDHVKLCETSSKTISVGANGAITDNTASLSSSSETTGHFVIEAEELCKKDKKLNTLTNKVNETQDTDVSKTPCENIKKDSSKDMKYGAVLESLKHASDCAPGTKPYVSIMTAFISKTMSKDTSPKKSEKSKIATIIDLKKSNNITRSMSFQAPSKETTQKTSELSEGEILSVKPISGKRRQSAPTSKYPMTVQKSVTNEREKTDHIALLKHPDLNTKTSGPVNVSSDVSKQTKSTCTKDDMAAVAKYDESKKEMNATGEPLQSRDVTEKKITKTRHYSEDFSVHKDKLSHVSDPSQTNERKRKLTDSDGQRDGVPGKERKIDEKNTTSIREHKIQVVNKRCSSEPCEKKSGKSDIDKKDHKLHSNVRHSSGDILVNKCNTVTDSVTNKQNNTEVSERKHSCVRLEEVRAKSEEATNKSRHKSGRPSVDGAMLQKQSSVTDSAHSKTGITLEKLAGETKGDEVALPVNHKHEYQYSKNRMIDTLVKENTKGARCEKSSDIVREKSHITEASGKSQDNLSKELKIDKIKVKVRHTSGDKLSKEMRIEKGARVDKVKEKVKHRSGEHNLKEDRTDKVFDEKKAVLRTDERKEHDSDRKTEKDSSKVDKLKSKDRHRSGDNYSKESKHTNSAEQKQCKVNNTKTNQVSNNDNAKDKAGQSSKVAKLKSVDRKSSLDLADKRQDNENKPERPEKQTRVNEMAKQGHEENKSMNEDRTVLDRSNSSERKQKRLHVDESKVETLKEKVRHRSGDISTKADKPSNSKKQIGVNIEKSKQVNENDKVQAQSEDVHKVERVKEHTRPDSQLTCNDTIDTNQSSKHRRQSNEPLENIAAMPEHMSKLDKMKIKSRHASGEIAANRNSRTSSVSSVIRPSKETIAEVKKQLSDPCEGLEDKCEKESKIDKLRRHNWGELIPLGRHTKVSYPNSISTGMKMVSPTSKDNSEASTVTAPSNSRDHLNSYDTTPTSVKKNGPKHESTDSSTKELSCRTPQSVTASETSGDDTGKKQLFNKNAPRVSLFKKFNKGSPVKAANKPVLSSKKSHKKVSLNSPVKRALSHVKKSLKNTPSAQLLNSPVTRKVQTASLYKSKVTDKDTTINRNIFENLTPNNESSKHEPTDEKEKQMDLLPQEDRQCTETDTSLNQQSAVSERLCKESGSEGLSKQCEDDRSKTDSSKKLHSRLSLGRREQKKHAETNNDDQLPVRKDSEVSERCDSSRTLQKATRKEHCEVSVRTDTSSTKQMSARKENSECAVPTDSSSTKLISLRKESSEVSVSTDPSSTKQKENCVVPVPTDSSSTNKSYNKECSRLVNIVKEFISKKLLPPDMLSLKFQLGKTSIEIQRQDNVSEVNVTFETIQGEVKNKPNIVKASHSNLPSSVPLYDRSQLLKVKSVEISRTSNTETHQNNPELSKTYPEKQMCSNNSSTETIPSVNVCLKSIFNRVKEPVETEVNEESPTLQNDDQISEDIAELHQEASSLPNDVTINDAIAELHEEAPTLPNEVPMNDDIVELHKEASTLLNDVPASEDIPIADPDSEDEYDDDILPIDINMYTPGTPRASVSISDDNPVKKDSEGADITNTTKGIASSLHKPVIKEERITSLCDTKQELVGNEIEVGGMSDEVKRHKANEHLASALSEEEHGKKSTRTPQKFSKRVIDMSAFLDDEEDAVATVKDEKEPEVMTMHVTKQLQNSEDLDLTQSDEELEKSSVNITPKSDEHKQGSVGESPNSLTEKWMEKAKQSRLKRPKRRNFESKSVNEMITPKRGKKARAASDSSDPITPPSVPEIPDNMSPNTVYEKGFPVTHRKVLKDLSVVETFAHLDPQRFYDKKTCGKCLLCDGCQTYFTPLQFTVHHHTKAVLDELDHSKCHDNEYSALDPALIYWNELAETIFDDFQNYIKTMKRLRRQPDVTVPGSILKIQLEQNEVSKGTEDKISASRPINTVQDTANREVASLALGQQHLSLQHGQTEQDKSKVRYENTVPEFTATCMTAKPQGVLPGNGVVQPVCRVVQPAPGIVQTSSVVTTDQYPGGSVGVLGAPGCAASVNISTSHTDIPQGSATRPFDKMAAYRKRHASNGQAIYPATGAHTNQPGHFEWHHYSVRPANITEQIRHQQEQFKSAHIRPGAPYNHVLGQNHSTNIANQTQTINASAAEKAPSFDDSVPSAVSGGSLPGSDDKQAETLKHSASLPPMMNPLTASYLPPQLSSHYVAKQKSQSVLSEPSLTVSSPLNAQKAGPVSNDCVNRVQGVTNYSGMSGIRTECISPVIEGTVAIHKADDKDSKEKHLQKHLSFTARQFAGLTAKAGGCLEQVPSLAPSYRDNYSGNNVQSAFRAQGSPEGAGQSRIVAQGTYWPAPPTSTSVGFQEPANISSMRQTVPSCVTKTESNKTTEKCPMQGISARHDGQKLTTVIQAFNGNGTRVIDKCANLNPSVKNDEEVGGCNSSSTITGTGDSKTDRSDQAITQASGSVRTSSGSSPRVARQLSYGPEVDTQLKDLCQQMNINTTDDGLNLLFLAKKIHMLGLSRMNEAVARAELRRKEQEKIHSLEKRVLQLEKELHKKQLE